MSSHSCINVEVSNLESRKDRFQHVQSVFKDISEFNVSLHTPIPEKHPDISILKSIASYVKKNYNLPYFIYAEDDVILTEDFKPASFVKNVEWMDGKADLLLGGVSSVKSMQTSLYDLPANVFRIDGYRGSHFMVIYKSSYDTIIKLSENPDFITGGFERAFNDKFRIYTFHPFIAKQKDFGYSDTGHLYTQKLDSMFDKADSKLEFLKKTRMIY